MKSVKAVTAIILCVLCLTLSCCTQQSNDLCAKYTRSSAVTVYDFFSNDSLAPEGYGKFADAYMDFSANLLLSSSCDESYIVSPFSLYTALSMTANGTAGKTLNQLEKVLGQDLDITEINNYLYYLSSRLTAIQGKDGKLSTANSLWLNDEFSVKAQFLQTLANYFDAEVYRTRLSETGADEINRWISQKTDGKIKEAVSPLSEDTFSVLVNALLFNDRWISAFDESLIYTDSFNGSKGSEKASYMKSNEMLLKSADAKGFIKSYENTPCKLVAILPDEGINLESYIQSLSGAKLEALFRSASGANRCEASIPRFEVRTKQELTEVVKAMGASLVFTEDANFDSLTMTDGLSVSSILQESFIKVTPTGTEAGSATVTDINATSSPEESQFESLVFNRPFLFMIVENESNLPLFMGTVQSIG